MDSAGARITDQVEMFPGRRGAGRIFYNEVHLSGVVPQVCLLFGPSAAGGAYIPAFCDLVIMVDGNASMYLGSPAHGRDGHRREGHARGDGRREDALLGLRLRRRAGEDRAGGDRRRRRRYLGYFPQNFSQQPRPVPAEAAQGSGKRIDEIIPADQNKPFDMYALINELIDEGSLFEVKKLFAQELITGLARIDGRPVGIVANQPKYKGGVLFVDSADKAARFIWLCDAFNIPLLYLADVPGFMIGTKVERAGIIRAGAKMISAVSEATVPEISRRGPQGLRRGPLRHERPGLRARTAPSRCPRR